MRTRTFQALLALPLALLGTAAARLAGEAEAARGGEDPHSQLASLERSGRVLEETEGTTERITDLSRAQVRAFRRSPSPEES